MALLLYLVDTMKRIKHICRSRTLRVECISPLFYIRELNTKCKKIIGYDANAANALYLWAISQEMPTGKHEHIETYDLEQFNQDILNNKLFGFVQVDIETPEDLKEYFSEMTPIFKKAEIKFEDIGEYMQNYHTENKIPFNKGKKLIGSYFGKEIVLYTPLLKWYLQKGLVITKFHCAIKYTPRESFQFADEVSDARELEMWIKLMNLLLKL